MFAGYSEFPFSHFDEFNAFPQQRRRPATTPSFKYYETLGISRSANSSQIRTAFKQLARRMHPDKGGDPEKFKALNEAYEVLKDDHKRRRYDELGDDGLLLQTDGRSSSTQVDDLFEELMGLRGRSRRARTEPQRSKNVYRSIEVSLEDVYNGAKRQLTLTGKSRCAVCKGTGFKGAVRHPCVECRGQGMKISIMQFGNGIIQETQRSCESCGGTGLDANPNNYCRICCGAGEVNSTRSFDVYVEQGMDENHEIKFHGEAPLLLSHSRMEPGDLIVTIRCLKHPRFKRKGFDLVTTHKIGICDALCGFDLNIKQLDGRLLHIQSKPGEVIKPGQVKCLEDEGLPVHGQPHLKGNLYIQFEVLYPDGLSPQQQEALKHVLKGPLTRQDIHEEVMDEHLIERTRDVEDLHEELASRENFGYHNGMAYESDDSEEPLHSGQRVQCAQQ
eukprot:g2829.t1